jgi:Cu+-exporting ATPase
MNHTASRKTVTDPVCGMKIDPETAVGSSRYKGQAYYFCSRSCEAKFDADPEKYLSGGREPMGGPS